MNGWTHGWMDEWIDGKINSADEGCDEVLRDNMLIHTFPLSIHFVNITIVSRPCSQTIRQKSCTVLVMGPT